MPIMKDGFPTIFVNLGGGEGIEFYEKRIKPPSLDGRAKIDTTGMRNQNFVTSWPRALIETGDATLTVAWAPAYWNRVRLLINGGRGNLGRKPVFITLRFPDGEEMGFYATINKFEPNEHVEGEQPTANMTITIHNVNQLNVESDIQVAF